MFSKSDTGIVRIANGIKQGMETQFDYVLVVSGPSGVGKSKWTLHFIELWFAMIGKELDKKTITHINVDRNKWLKKFKDMEAYDINVFDEAAIGLSNKQWMERFAKTLEMLFDVVRYKRFLSVIVIPNFFRLNKFFREDRLRGLVWIDKRGQYKYYTRERIVKLSNLNERRFIKRMDLTQPIHLKSFTDYNGYLSKDYDKMKNIGVDEILDKVIEMNKEKKKYKTLYENNMDKVKKLKEEGLTQRDMAKKLGVSLGTINNIIANF